MEEEDDDKKEKKEEGGHDLTEKMMETRTIILSGDVDKELAEKVVTQLLLLEAAGDDPIKIFIDSPGGDVDAGFAIFDMMRFVKPDVYTIGMGLVASAGALILLAAPEEHRLAFPNSHYLIHQPLSGIRGVATEIEIHAKELEKLRGLYEYCWVMSPPDHQSIHVPYNLLAFLVKMAPKGHVEDFLLDKLRSYRYLQKTQLVNSDFNNRVQYALNWSQDFEEIKETKIVLNQKEKKAIIDLISNLNNEDEADKIQNTIFNIAKAHNLKPRIFFRLLYSILMGANHGPRLGPYILEMGVKNVIDALNRVSNS